MSIAVTTSFFDLQSYAKKWADQLGLLFVQFEEAAIYDYLLEVSPAGLGCEALISRYY